MTDEFGTRWRRQGKLWCIIGGTGSDVVRCASHPVLEPSEVSFGQVQA